MAKNLIVKVGIKGAKKSVGALKSVGGAVSFVGKASAVTGAGVAALSTKLAGDFQKSLLEISTLMKGTTERDLRVMSKELRAVAVSSGVALDSLSKAKYDIVSAGFSSAAESAEVLNVASKLAVGGVTSVAEAADLLTTSLNALGLESDDTNKVADELFTTVRLGKTTMTELSASLGQVLPFARSAGLDLQGVGAAMATLTASGISTAQATTSLRATLVSLQSPAKGSKEAMEQAGIEIKRFDDGTLDLISTIKQFQGIDPDTLKQIIPRVEAILGIQTMAQNFETLKDNVDEFAKDSADATEKAFKKMSKGFNQQMSMIKNSLQAIMIEIGTVIIDEIEGPLSEVNKEFQNLAEIGFDNLGSAVKDNLPAIMDAFQLTMMIAFNHVEKRSRIMALSIKEHLRDAMPFIEGEFDKITEFSRLMDVKAQQDAELLAKTYSEMYAKITKRAEEYSEDDFDLRDAIVENYVNGVLVEEGAQASSLNNKIENEKKAAETIDEIRTELSEKEKERVLEDLENKNIFYQASLAAHDQFVNTLTDTEMHGAERRKKIEEALKNSAIRFIGEHTKAFIKNKFQEVAIQKATNKLKEASASSSAVKEFLITQSKNIAGVFADGAKIVSGILAGMGPFALVAAPAVIATVGALTASLISSIQSRSLKFAEGGMVPGVDRGQGDTVPAMLTPGELILNQAQQNNLAGGLGGVTINFTGPVTNDEYVRDFIIPEIDKVIKSNLA